MKKNLIEIDRRNTKIILELNIYILDNVKSIKIFLKKNCLTNYCWHEFNTLAYLDARSLMIVDIPR